MLDAGSNYRGRENRDFHWIQSDYLSDPGVISGGVCKAVEQIAYHFHTVVTNPFFQSCIFPLKHSILGETSPIPKQPRAYYSPQGHLR